MNGGGVEEVSMEGKGGVGGAVRDGEMGAATEAAAVSLEALRKRMADFARERDWEQFHSPRNLLLALVRSPLATTHLLCSLVISMANLCFFIWRLLL